MNFKNKSVESITAKLSSTVEELEQHAQDQLTKANLKQQEARVLEAEHKAHKAEHELAKKVAGNIKALLGA